jgi:cytochrome bd ubiquinol oxidase subunit II
MLASVAFGLYPDLLPASTNSAASLTVDNSAAANYGLKIGLVWWTLGIILATVYFVMAYRRFAGKVSVLSDEEGY